MIRRATGGAADYLARIGGGDAAVLRVVPSGKARYAQFGFLLLGRALIFAVLLGYAVSAFGFPVIGAVAAGLLWGPIDYAATRFLLQSLSISLTRLRQVAIALPGVILSALIAILVTPSIAVPAVTGAGQPGEGFLTRLEALSRSAEHSLDAEVSVWVIFALCWIIGLLPITAKLLANLAPPTAYDKVLKVREDIILEHARREQTEARMNAERRSQEEMALDEAASKARIAVAEDIRQREAALGIAGSRKVQEGLQETLDAVLRAWQERMRAELATGEDFDSEAALAKLIAFTREGQDLISKVKEMYPRSLNEWLERHQN